MIQLIGGAILLPLPPDEEFEVGWQTNWAPEDIRAHIDFQLALNKELTDQGELVDPQGLAGPDGHYRLDAVRAHLFEMAGDAEAAVAYYRAAASRTTSIPEQHYLAALAARTVSR